MIANNWPLLILTDFPEIPRKLTIAVTVKMCGNEAKVSNKRFDRNWGNLYKRDLPHSNIFLLSEYHLFYFEVNLMPYGFLSFWGRSVGALKLREVSFLPPGGRGLLELD